MSRPVSESIHIDELSDIQRDVEDAYGVDAENINIEIVYQTSGNITINVTDDTISDEELAEAFEEEIATLLGIHESSVEVTVDHGVVSYIITSSTAETAQVIQDSLVEPELLTNLEGSLPIGIESFNLNDLINAEVVVTVDTSGAENNLSRSAEILEETFQNQGYDAKVESNF